MIGSLGPEGSFTAFALESYISRSKLTEQVIYFDSFRQIFNALSENKINKVFIPLENSIGGDVFSVLEELISLDLNYKISDEFQCLIEQSLLATKTMHFKDVDLIYSHEQSMRQSNDFIQKNCINAKFQTIDSNSKAAQLVSGFTDKNYACIGHKKLADIYGLVVLEKNIANEKGNKTRFVLISEENTQPSGNDKSSFIFSSHKDQPGSLVDVLLELSDRNINLTRISSFPTRKMLGDYLFFIDFLGHCEDSSIKECLDVLRSKCSYFKFLGSYPKGDTNA
jgi:prephenate dehydratase